MAEEKRFYFAKVTVDYMLRNLDLMKLRKEDGGDTNLIIYHKILAESLETLGELYFISTLEEYAEDFATLYHEEPEAVEKALHASIKLGLIEEYDDHIFLTQAPSLIGSETAAAGRMRAHRARKKTAEELKKRNNVQDGYTDVTPQLQTEEQCSKSLLYIDIDTDIDNRDRNKDIDTDIDNSQSVTQIADHINYKQIVDLYHEYCPSLPKVAKLTDQRKKAIKKILKKYTVDELINAFEIAEQSSFLRGECNSPGHESFKGDFDFILRENRLVSILEGKYSDNKNIQKPKSAQEMEDWYQMAARWASEEPNEDNSG